MTDSPWFWVLVFSLCGLAALLAMSGKYGRRQAGIERKYQVRERIARQDMPGAEVLREDEAEGAGFSTADSTLIPLWPLAIPLAVLAAASVAMLYRHSKSSPGDCQTD